jgi:hypothetical protein
MNPNPMQLLATVCFAPAVAHTLSVKRFARLAHRSPDGSSSENVCHFLAETEVVFGVWASALLLGIAALGGSVDAAVQYIGGLNFTEPKFVLVVRAVAATRPVVRVAESVVQFAARSIPLP